MKEYIGFFRRHQYAVLFYSLLLCIPLISLFSQLNVPTGTIALFLNASLLIAIITIESRRLRIALYFIIGVATLEHFLPLVLNEGQLLYYSMLMLSLVALVAGANSLKYALFSRKIGGEQIYAALAAYLQAGVFLGTLYFILEKLHPGSFYLQGKPVQDFFVADGMYFSFVTLTTLGYGDYVAHNQLARSLAIVEAVAGQLYLAVMLARMVSHYVAEQKRESQENH